MISANVQSFSAPSKILCLFSRAHFAHIFACEVTIARRHQIRIVIFTAINLMDREKKGAIYPLLHYRKTIYSGISL